MKVHLTNPQPTIWPMHTPCGYYTKRGYKHSSDPKKVTCFSCLSILHTQMCTRQDNT